jgi:hypothetical protein
MPRNQYLLKIHPSFRGGSEVIAICDKKHIGKRYESASAVVLDLEKHRRFYDGDEAGGEAVVAALENCANVNAVGEKSVALACEALKIPKSCAKRIGGVPHLQIYRI